MTANDTHNTTDDRTDEQATGADEETAPCESCGIETPVDGAETAHIGDHAILCVHCLDAMAATGELQAMEDGESVTL